MEIDSRLADLHAERQRIEEAFPPQGWVEPISMEQLNNAFGIDEMLEPDLLRFIIQLELLALPVCAEAADENMAFELVGSTMVKYALAFGPYIEYQRMIRDQPDLYCYLTNLVDSRWAERDRLERVEISRGALPYFLRGGSKTTAK